MGSSLFNSFPLSYFYTGLSLYNMVVAGFAVAVVSYILGDLIILPRTGNMIATIADFGLSFLTLWLLSYAMNMGYTFNYLAIASLALTLGEFLFHIYLEGQHRVKERF